MRACPCHDRRVLCDSIQRLSFVSPLLPLRNRVLHHVQVQHLSFLLRPSAVVVTPYPAPTSRCSMSASKFEGWHSDACVGVIPRRRVHGRDLGKTLSRSIVTFESIDSIPPSDVHDAHFPSLLSTTASILSLPKSFRSTSHLTMFRSSAMTPLSMKAQTSHPLRQFFPCPWYRRALAWESWA
ncbi:hypothetical protein ARMGADRAFT_824793 [Armillaria gallica]|uniref:Uncharacterized protein n=1 Tax=Armillaria gallica TaxID=47427 RepID=A0A2H3CCD0_ARMGA|nr:hypothetical protein ARMGADRAFT_824793 [Armillaria gallica]